MPAEHSNWSASGFEQVMLCPGSKVLQAGLPRSTSHYAAEGTAAHQVLTWALQEQRPAAAYIGRVIEADGYAFTVDDDMAAHVQVTIDYVLDVAGDTGVILVDRRVDYSAYLGLPEGEAWGTLDVAILLSAEVVSVDLKYGMGVEVSAGEDLEREVPYDRGGQTEYTETITHRKPNPQLALYALGALQEFADFGDFERVRLVISQPRISKKPSEYDLPIADLEAWATSTARSAVNTARNADTEARAWGGEVPEWQDTFLRPGDKQCRFCKAKATCPALRDDVADTIGISAASPEDFLESKVPSTNHIAPTDEAWLSAALAKCDLIEDWCKAVRAEVERRLLAGLPVMGFKLVQGKKGNRQWSDADAATDLLRNTFRLPVEKAFDMKVISPTTAEKLFKAGDIGPRQWPKAQALITQSEGKAHVAPVTDPRPALAVRPVSEDFEPVADVSDLA